MNKVQDIVSVNSGGEVGFGGGGGGQQPQEPQPPPPPPPPSAAPHPVPTVSLQPAADGNGAPGGAEVIGGGGSNGTAAAPPSVAVPSVFDPPSSSGGGPRSGRTSMSAAAGSAATSLMGRAAAAAKNRQRLQRMHAQKAHQNARIRDISGVATGPMGKAPSNRVHIWRNKGPLSRGIIPQSCLLLFLSSFPLSSSSSHCPGLFFPSSSSKTDGEGEKLPLPLPSAPGWEGARPCPEVFVIDTDCIPRQREGEERRRKFGKGKKSSPPPLFEEGEGRRRRRNRISNFRAPIHHHQPAHGPPIKKKVLCQ